MDKVCVELTNIELSYLDRLVLDIPRLAVHQFDRIGIVGKGLLGYNDYHEGADHRFAGVRLLDEFKFSLTIAASELPNFYETTFVSVHPSYKDGWSYFSKVDSNSDGAKLTSNSSDWTLAFDTKRIAQTERYAPTVTSGPFTFVSFENNIITLAANPMFKGDHKGQKPQLDYVIIKNISEQFEVENCINGEVDAINGVMEDYKIESALASSAVEVTSFHPRNGFGGDVLPLRLWPHPV